MHRPALFRMFYSTLKAERFPQSWRAWTLVPNRRTIVSSYIDVWWVVRLPSVFMLPWLWNFSFFLVIATCFKSNLMNRFIHCTYALRLFFFLKQGMTFKKSFKMTQLLQRTSYRVWAELVSHTLPEAGLQAMEPEVKLPYPKWLASPQSLPETPLRIFPPGVSFFVSCFP